MPLSSTKGTFNFISSFNKSLIIVYFVYLQFVSKHVNATITIYNQKNQSIELMDDYSAQFGPRLPQQGLKGYLNIAKPLNGCSILAPPPSNVSYVTSWIALIQRTQSTNGNCSFDFKVWNAQQAGYQAVIVYNVGSDGLVKMSSSGHYQIKIPSVFIGESDATELANLYTYLNKTYLVITEDEYNLFAYLIPFAVIVGICFIIMVSIFIIKCVLYYHTTRKNRLSKSALKKLPTKKYQKTDKYDTCPICLDEYEEGVKLRILPCEHMYHIKCIDEWLLKNNRSCPVCKRKVLPGDESDDDSSEETSVVTRNQNTDNTDQDQALINIAENDDDDETTRLINPSTSNIDINNQTSAAAAAPLANGTTTIIQMVPSILTNNEEPVQQQQQQQVLSTSVASTNSNGSTQYGSIVSTANNSNFTNSIQIDPSSSNSPTKSSSNKKSTNVNKNRIDNRLTNSTRTSPLSANAVASSSLASSSHFKSADDDDDDELLNELHDKTLNTNDDDDNDSDDDDDDDNNDDDGDDVALLQPNEAAASSSSSRRNKKKNVKDFKIDV